MRMLVIASWLGVAALASAEDLTIVSNVTRNGEAAGTQTSYLAADHIRMAQAEGSEFMLDGKTGVMTLIDTKKKEYSVVTEADLTAMAATMQAKQGQLQEQMKSMPPALRDKIANLGGAATVAKTGATRKIAGYSCDTWMMAIGEIVKTESCLSSDVAVPAQVWTRYRAFAEQMQVAMRAAGPMAKSFTDLQEKMKGMQGFPLAQTTTATFLGKTQTTTTEVTEVRKGAIPASAFEIPAGFKQVDSPFAKLAKK